MTSAETRPMSITTAIMTEATILQDNTIKRKIENATEGLSCSCFNQLFDMVLPGSKQNALTICDYMSSIKSEINPSDHYRKSTILLLCRFSIFLKYTKPFKEITREDFLSSELTIYVGSTNVMKLSDCLRRQEFFTHS